MKKKKLPIASMLWMLSTERLTAIMKMAQLELAKREYGHKIAPAAMKHAGDKRFLGKAPVGDLEK